MSMTDPIADMLTRIRNALRIERDAVNVPSSNVKEGVAEVLKKEGFIEDFKVIEDNKQNILRVYLKYGDRGEKVINHIQRISTPGRRIYRKAEQLKKQRVLNGLGVAIVSTSQGILSDRDCRKKNIGGEVLCNVW